LLSKYMSILLCRYFPLLGKVGEDGMTPLTHIFQLLHAKSVKPTVVNVILELVDNLFTMADETEKEREEQIPVGNTTLDQSGTGSGSSLW
jgi:hypothetical protein